MVPAQNKKAFPSPKNGKYYVALIAGGPSDIGREVRDRLLHRMGILAKFHWSYDRSKCFLRKVPDCVDFVLILKDFIGHSDGGKVRATCKKLGVPTFYTQSKWTPMYRVFWTQHIKARDLPIEVTSSAILNDYSGDLIEFDVPPIKEGVKEQTVLPSVVVPPSQPVPTKQPSGERVYLDFNGADEADVIYLLAREIQSRMEKAGLAGVIVTTTSLSIDKLSK